MGDWLPTLSDGSPIQQSSVDEERTLGFLVNINSRILCDPTVTLVIFSDNVY
jgi:hypothetical protein